MKSFKRIIISIFLILVGILFQSNQLTAQKTEVKKQLAGYNYKEIVENADISEPELPLVIVLHWMGSSPEGFTKYITGFKCPIRLILVEATYPFREGFSFFTLSPYYYKLPDDEKMASLLEEGEKLSKFIKAATKLYKPKKKPAIIGASQGGDLSYVTAIKYPNLISLSCPLLATMDNRIITPKDSSGIPIVVFHGTSDPIVPIDVAEKHVNLLKTKGYNVRLKKYEGVKHEIPDEMKKDYIELISKHFY